MVPSCAPMIATHVAVSRGFRGGGGGSGGSGGGPDPFLIWPERAFYSLFAFLVLLFGFVFFLEATSTTTRQVVDAKVVSFRVVGKHHNRLEMRVEVTNAANTWQQWASDEHYVAECRTVLTGERKPVWYSTQTYKFFFEPVHRVSGTKTFCKQ